MLIALDTGPLGDLINPNNTPETRAIRSWMKTHLSNGAGFLLPEIADYEVRRNEILETLICPFGPSQSAAALHLLDQLKAAITYLPLNTTTMLVAAQLWGEHRKGHGPGHPTRSPKLDGDVILTAQAMVASAGQHKIVIATMNLRDFLFIPTPTVTAQEWNTI
jgi:predicted nucleic acid-binding protein